MKRKERKNTFKRKLAPKALVALAACAFLLGAVEIFHVKNQDDKSARILFVGDIMLDRTMRKVGEKKGYGYLFSCLDGYLRQFDLVVGNLEGPVTENVSRSLGTKPGEDGNTTFTFDPAAISALRKAGVGAVSLGNNHIWDFGGKGARETMSALSKEGIVFFGSPNGSDVATTTAGHSRVALVSFNQFLGKNHPEETVAQIWKARKDADIVAVYAHWGDEYSPADEYQKALAHRFIDAGADIVVGSHSHVIQEREIYKGKPIFYSLGNFIFDQYWTNEVRTGGGAEIEAQGKNISARERRFDLLFDGRTCLK